MNPSPYERPSSSRVIEKNEFDSLDNLMGAIADKLIGQKIPVTRDGRIDMGQYESLFSLNEDDQKEFASNQEKVSRLSGEFSKNTLGEQFEKMKTIVFHKFLADEFIVCRTSQFDDYENKIDNIILERTSGNLVCAMDEVMDESGLRFSSKKDKVRAKNLGGGAMLKYSLKMNGNEVEKTLKTRRLPLFHLALSAEKVIAWIKNAGTSLEKVTADEKQLFSYFVRSMLEQAKDLMHEEVLNEALRKNIVKFYTSLKRIEEKYAEPIQEKK